MAAKTQIRNLETTAGPNKRLITKSDGSWKTDQHSPSTTIAWVDPILGNNTDAVLGEPTKPFRDPWAAKDAIESKSSSVQYLMIWLPGEYTVGSDSGNLKVITNASEGDLYSQTHEISHYLYKGATITLKSAAVGFILFKVNGTISLNIYGQGSFYYTNNEAPASRFIEQSGTGGVYVEFDLIFLTKGSGSNYSIVKVTDDSSIKIKSEIVVTSDTKLIEYNTSSNSKIEVKLDLSIGNISGQQNGLIYHQGLDTGSRGFKDSYINIDIKSGDINGIGSIANFYRTSWEDSIVNIKTSNLSIERSSANSAIASFKEGLIDNTIIGVDINNSVVDTDYLVDLNFTSSNVSPHPANDGIVNITLDNIKYNTNGSYSGAPIVKYDYFEAVEGLRVTLNVNGVFENRNILKFSDNQNLTVSGYITTTGVTEPFLVTEVLSQGTDADYDYKIFLKDLYVETPDSVDVIDVNGFTGSKIVTSNYNTRTSADIVTL